MAEFDWWLLIVGLVVGAVLAWLVVSDSRRRDEDLDDAERASETVWITARLKPAHPRIDAALVDAVLAEHRDYLAGPPPDPVDPADPQDVTPGDPPGSDPDAASERAGKDGLGL